jgi:SAM-dependent methyltransferase
MSYKVFLFDALSPVEWSQVAWKLEGQTVSTDDCRIEFIHDVLLANLPRDGLILDAGCGVARWPIYLRRQGYRVFGMEYSHDACRIAKANDPGLQVVRGDVRRKALKDASVDAVLSLGVVEHEEAGPDAAMREIHRVLKPGGTLILAVPYNNWWRRAVMNPVLSAITRRRRQRQWRLGFAEYRFDAREVRDFVERAGFAVHSMHPNDLRPPKNMGLWVDYNNVVMNPLKALPPQALFILPGLKGTIARAVTRWTPWLVCGEIVVVARRV